MNKKTRIYMVQVTIILLYAITGCVAKNSSTVNTSVTLKTPSSATIEPTETSIITIISATNVVPISPTWTPQPTLSVADAQEKVVELIKDNGGCDLPCWWGIMPGKTTWTEAESFLDTLSPKIIDLGNDEYGVTFKNLPNNISGGAIGATISINNNTVQTIRTDIYYQLPVFLKKYGEPNEIWIFTDHQSLNSEMPFTIALFYKDRGILAVYNGTATKTEKTEICPVQQSGFQTAWLLWNPELRLPFSDAGRTILLFENQPEDRPFYRLENVSNLDVATFQKTYIHSENEGICFELTKVDDQ